MERQVKTGKNNKRKRGIAPAATLLAGLLLAGCAVFPASSFSGRSAAASARFSPITLPDYIEEAVNIDAFTAQGEGGNEAHMEGIVLSPYVSVTVEDTAVPCYAVPVTKGGPHSFAYIQTDGGAFSLTVKVKRSGITSAQVLPATHGVAAAVSGGTAECVITETGSYTFIFNDSYEKPFTLFVRRTEVPAVSEGDTLIEYKSGLHFVNSIDITEDNTVVYLHPGALLVAVQPDAETETPVAAEDWAGQTRWKPFVNANGRKNVRLVGAGVIDCTNLDWHARAPVDFSYCQDVYISGVTLINAPEWDLSLRYCERAEVRDVVIFGYRQNSDGIAVVDSRDVRIEDCFARAGDDLFEVKSMHPGVKIPTGNIVFRGCVAWADKCRAYGVIQETRRDISGVLFEACSVLYRFGIWSDVLGSLVVIAGDEGDVSDITFRDMDIHSDYGYVMNVSLGNNEWSSGTTAGSVRGVRFENIRFTGENRTLIKAPAGGNPEALDNIVFSGIYRNGMLLRTLSEIGIDFSGAYCGVYINNF